MFNSVVSYLWGDYEGGSTEAAVAGQKPAEVELPLDVRQEEDWLVVEEGEEKASLHPSHCHSHVNLEDLQQNCDYQKRGDPSDPIPIPPNPSLPYDLDNLDDASSLEKEIRQLSMSCSPKDKATYVVCDEDEEEEEDDEFPLRDLANLFNTCLNENDYPDSDTESYENVRPSSPESVFSMCSGRSHGTYKPHGCPSRDPWIVAPPPCFTGSRAGELSTIESSPLENLLIEHPSMSVYLSFPPSSLSPSHPFYSAVVAGARSPVREEVPSSRLRRPEDDTEGPAPPTVDARRRQVQQQNNAHAAAVLSSENIVTRLRSAQKAQKKKSSKSLSKHKLERENKVYDKSWANKNSNGKQNRPSGCKSGRMCQRV